MSQHYCPSCRKVLDYSHPVGGKLAAGALSVLFGRSFAKTGWGHLVAVGLGAALGHVVDTQVTPRCPACGAVLRALVAIA